MSAMESARWLAGKSIALSISESEDLLARGLSLDHLNDAFAELARALLALGAQLVYGGDLRSGGYTELLFELVARYGSRTDAPGPSSAVVDFLAHPVHAPLGRDDILDYEARFDEIGSLVYLGRDGGRLTREQRLAEMPVSIDQSEWPLFLTAMREAVVDSSHAKIVLGGRRTGFLGRMPGVMEEVLIASQHEQPLFIIGGFGGISHDLALCGESGAPLVASEFDRPLQCNNGLDAEELNRLATSPHVDELGILVVRGLRRCLAPL